MASSSPPPGSSETAKAQDASSASGTDIWSPIKDDLPLQDQTTNISSPNVVETLSTDAAESERRARIAKGKQPMGDNPPPGIDQASDFTEAGLSAITAADYNTAVECLHASRDLRVGHYGEYSPECLAAHCQYIAAIIFKHCNVPAPSTPKPRDAAGSGKKEELKADKGKAADETYLNPDLGWQVLGVAKAISETQSTARKLEMLSREMAQKDADDTIEKADILSSCGDAAMKRKDFVTARGDYEKALSIAELTPDSYSRRIAELNFGISLCFEAEGNLEQAILSCCKALLACQYGQKLLEDDLQSPAGSGGHSTSTSDLSPKSEPSGGEVPELDKGAQLGLLNELSEHIGKKLQELRQANFQLISCKPSAPSEMSDTRKAIIIDSSSDSVNQQGRGGKGLRSEINDTAESPSKKPKPDSPSGKGTAS